MKTNINYFKDLESFISQINNLNTEYLLLVATNTLIEIEKINTLNITGAIFPEIIYENKLYDSGLIAIEIKNNMKVHFYDDISKTYDFYKTFNSTKSIITLLDGISIYNESFLQNLFCNVNINTNIIGGGAGTINGKNKKVIFNNKGFYNNSAILLSLETSINIGVKHGWEYLTGPFVVTSSEKNILKQLDYKSAFNTYKNIIEKDCGIVLTKNNFQEISQNYPIGIVRYMGEQIVRDPISYENGNLVLVGEISNNSIINILKGDKQKLLDSAKEATTQALKEDCESIIIFECISRKEFLRDKFDEELNNIFSLLHNQKGIGAVTIGEVANSGNRYINFFNKTCVVGGICF
ncbi:FIST signal transduction protein [Poseidonibacter sp.]|uniref:FIST signal transduction protein n=1 Tax=Poseidonibacter sp. TaxID=2321188 RepID=UPI003C72E8F8